MLEYFCHILITVMIFIILGIAYNLVMGYAGIISLAHAVFFAVGGYTTALLMLHFGLPFLVVILASIFTAGVIGAAFMLLVGRVRSDYLVIVTLGFQLVFISVLINLKSLTGGTTGLMGIPRPELFGFQFSSEPSYAVLAVILTGIAFMVAWFINGSPFGRSLKAIREDEVGAQSLGKNIVRYKFIIFAISGALAGIAGSLYAPYQQFINPYDFTLFESIIIMVIVIVGGAGNLWGAVIGGFVLVSIPEVLRFIPITSIFMAQLREVIFGLALLLVVWFRPQGILGEYAFGAVKTNMGEEEAEEGKLAEFGYQGAGFSTMENEGAKALVTNIKGPIFQVSNLSKSFGGIKAVDNVSFNITPEKKVIGIIGPNGAGKSTLFDLICGYTQSDAGTVYFMGRNITRSSPHDIARLGIGRSFQGLRLFRRLTVMDNVMVGLRSSEKDENTPHTFSTKLFAQNKHYKEQAIHLLDSVGLAEKRNELSEDLSYAEQKLLVLARLLALKSKLLLLDELAAGLDPESMEALARLIRGLAETGITVCLVEHSLDFVQSVVDTILFLDQGRLIAEGPTAEIVQDRRLSKIYFGVAE
jgi:branched-chain amino acid transport system permease protein